MNRPMAYYVMYVDLKLYEAEVKRAGCPCGAQSYSYHKTKEAASIGQAKKLAKKLHGAIKHRRNIVDATPPGDPPGLLWDWDDDNDFADETEYQHPSEEHNHENR